MPVFRADAGPRPRGRPRSEDTAEIENAVLAAALREFVECGYGGASMRNIAKRAQVARTTLLGRFATKDDLFRAIMTQQIERMAALSALRSDGPPDLRKGLIAYADRALAFSLEGAFLEVNRLIYGAAQHFPQVAAAAAETTRIGIGQITGFIAACARADGVACRQPEVPAESFILLLRGWHGLAMLGQRRVPPAERRAWIERMVDNLIAGRDRW
ncbi:TetR/AcrR family transcriptional regulator [Novosphingobium album (ex Liu et al. 2023)]|uniref:TetR/AcrR family transcriptional regulator n=1 Tax=Novosphingobium album (ex Liu et al. 2023) TaxID=3031130 RepID=A0ABT5WR95_9SPHN|nr:TetR/AcrR family transcriptional regulator [Novosphingobium album (ex Liu et al. 2023)]MDE8652515.1 TetR/AcrR family transcriptional regulator [Novosphingobium album (ex Liu et al. 2023)]